MVNWSLMQFGREIQKKKKKEVRRLRNGGFNGYKVEKENRGKVPKRRRGKEKETLLSFGVRESELLPNCH